MKTASGFVVLALCGALLAPATASAGSAGSAMVGGRGFGVHARGLSAFGTHAGVHHVCTGSVPIVVHDFGRRSIPIVPPFGGSNLTDFGRHRLVRAAPVVIQVDGDVEVVHLEGGGLRLVIQDVDD